MNMAQDVLRESFHTSGEETTYYPDPAGVAVARDSCCWPAAAAAPVGIDGTPSCAVAPGDQLPGAGRSACCA